MYQYTNLIIKAVFKIYFPLKFEKEIGKGCFFCFVFFTFLRGGFITCSKFKSFLKISFNLNNWYLQLKLGFKEMFSKFFVQFSRKICFCIKLQKLTRDGKLKICSDDPLLHANRFYAYFYGGKRVVFYIYIIYFKKLQSSVCDCIQAVTLFWQVSKLVYYYSLNVWETRRFLGAPELRGALAVNSSVHIIYCHQSNKA